MPLKLPLDHRILRKLHAFEEFLLQIASGGPSGGGMLKTTFLGFGGTVAVRDVSIPQGSLGVCAIPMISSRFPDFRKTKIPSGKRLSRLLPAVPRGDHLGDFCSISGCVLPSKNKGLERIPPKTTHHENLVGTYVSGPPFKQSPGRAGPGRAQHNKD